MVDDLVEPVGVDPAAGEAGGQLDVLGRGERRDQVERLEHEADAVPTQLGELAVVERGQVGVADEDGPQVRASSPATQCSSVDFPEPDGPMTAVNRPVGTRR